MQKKYLLLLVSVILLQITPNQGRLDCKTPLNESVDWFIALQLPKGDQYYYIDSTNYNSGFLRMAQGLNNITQSPLMLTLAQIQNLTTNSDNIGYSMWNDEPPGSTQSIASKAHSKGVQGYDSESGFHIVHSTPKFPILSTLDNITFTLNLNIDSSELIYGQHFFCISANLTSLSTIASVKYIDDVYVYDFNSPSSIFQYYPEFLMINRSGYDSYVQNNPKQVAGDQVFKNFLQKAEKQIKATPATPWGFGFFESLNGFQLRIYAQNKDWAVPFYDNVVAKDLNVSFLTETWGNGTPGLEDADCNILNTTYLNVVSNLKVQLKNDTFTYTQDHSKYGISLEQSKPFVCLGDMNRESSQDQRGGGTICFENQIIYNLFDSILIERQNCSVSSVSIANELIEDLILIQ